jgi:predicted RNase H-like HicB family nuclease
MSRHSFPVDVLMTACEDGVWTAWCPTLDLISQGDNLQHAIGMISDAISCVCESDLSRHQWSSWEEGYTVQRVTHPLRRSVTARHDPDFAFFEAYRDGTGEWGLTTEVDVRGLRLPEGGHCFAYGEVHLRVQGGILSHHVDLSDNVFVLGKQFMVSGWESPWQFPEGYGGIVVTLPSHESEVERMARLRDVEGFRGDIQLREYVRPG